MSNAWASSKVSKTIVNDLLLLSMKMSRSTRLVQPHPPTTGAEHCGTISKHKLISASHHTKQCQSGMRPTRRNISAGSNSDTKLLCGSHPCMHYCCFSCTFAVPNNRVKHDNGKSTTTNVIKCPNKTHPSSAMWPKLLSPMMRILVCAGRACAVKI